MNNFKIPVILIAIIILIFSGCEKEDPKLKCENGTGQVGSFTDFRDGQTYSTISIGNQTWMTEDLNYPRFDTVDSLNGLNNRRIYMWEEALAACPDGWHLPSNVEWDILSDYLGGSNIAGGKMKDEGTTEWDAPNTDATNCSGFSAVPGGQSKEGYFFRGKYCFLWSSTEASELTAWNRILNYNNGQLISDKFPKSHLNKVRCIKD